MLLFSQHYFEDWQMSILGIWCHKIWCPSEWECSLASIMHTSHTWLYKH